MPTTQVERIVGDQAALDELRAGAKNQDQHVALDEEQRIKQARINRKRILTPTYNAQRFS